ncbi:MAG: excinuclease ABC subunit UvrC [Bacteroidota bacterium]
METSLTLEEKVAQLPRSPGVYQFKDSDGNVLYVGKAKALRNRVRSYLQDASRLDARIRLMISKAEDLEVILTDSESEALILEHNLIQKLHPRYNIMYRDDKSYPYICITRGERPRVYPTRTLIKDGSRYIGPYDHVGHMRRVLETIRKTFGLCTCAVSSQSVDKNRGAPKWGSCFEDYLDNCAANWDLERYQDVMEKVERMLNGKTVELERQLREEMEIASSALAFEEAARLRDSIESLRRLNQKMKVVAEKQVHRDLFAVVSDPAIQEACGVLLKIREGKLVGKFHRFMRVQAGEASEEELLQAFMEDYYTGQYAGAIPDEVYMSHEIPDPEPLEAWLWETLGRKVRFHEPKIGEKRQLIRMATSNAKLLLGERALEKQKAARERIPQSVKDLKEFLHLDRLPRRIHCFDNSNLQGSDPVAAMVTFVDGKPRKSLYRTFHIKTVEGPDDFASMREVITRQYLRVKKGEEDPPDLILIDGGKGQLSSAMEALREIDYLDQVEVVGLAKRLEEVIVPGKAESVMIPKTSSALKLLQQARDEAHRSAITFHKKIRSGRTVTSELTKIPGIGTKRAATLIQTFGSARAVSEASLQTLEAETGPALARAIRNWYDGNSSEES